MAILIVLFATNMVANNFFGLSSNLMMTICFLLRFAGSNSKSVGVRENKATSAPEIKAENNNKSRSERMPKNWANSKIMGIIVKLGGSRSKIK